MDWIADPAIWASFATLLVLELVLGIDNLIFLAILAERLPPERQAAARRIGLGLALGARLALLGTIAWLAQLTRPVVTLGGFDLSWRDIILIAGGAFLIYKATREIHERLEGSGPHAPGGVGAAGAGFAAVVAQIVALDIVFSLDSVLTAIGVAKDVGVMAAAIVAAVGVMLVAAGPLAGFVQRHPTVKMLALAFLLLIGVTLVADGLGTHLPREMIYAAVAFSAAVEGLNLLAARRARAARDVPPGAREERPPA